MMRRSHILLLFSTCLILVTSSDIQTFRERLLENLESELVVEFEYRKSWVGNSSDQILENWLKYGDYNFEKAQKILQKSLNWRQANEIDSLLNYEYPKKFETEYPYKITGYTESGSAVWDFRKGLVKEYPEIKKYVIQMIERTMNEINPKTGLKPSKFIFIGDYTDYSLRQVTSLPVLSFTREIMDLFEKNYPHYLESSLIINAPGYFSIIFSIIKLFNPTTVDQIRVFGKRKSEWEPELRKLVPEDAYPFELILEKQK